MALREGVRRAIPGQGLAHLLLTAAGTPRSAADPQLAAPAQHPHHHGRNGIETDMTLKIYGVLRSRASRNVWLAKEAGLAFEHVPVIQAYRLKDPDASDAPLNTSSPAFRAINPNGLIPTLDDDGLILNESLAINLYLAKRYGGALGPRDAREDGLMTMWTVWAVTECEPRTIEVLYHRVEYPKGERNPAMADAAVAALERPFGVLE